MAEGDPWEINLLKAYCNTGVSLEAVSEWGGCVKVICQRV